MLRFLSATSEHVQRILKPAEPLFRHPVDDDLFQQEKRQIYESARAIEDIMRPITDVYTGPMPYTPEFDQLLPELEGFLYRRDPFHDWGIVKMILVSTFLLILNPVGDPPNQVLSVESLIPLLEPDVTIKLFSVSLTTV